VGEDEKERAATIQASCPQVSINVIEPPSEIVAQDEAEALPLYRQLWSISMQRDRVYLCEQVRFTSALDMNFLSA